MKSLKAAALICLINWPFFAEAEITVTPLGAIKKDGVGLMPPALSGIEAGFWGDSAPETIAAAFPLYQSQVLPAVNALSMRIALAELSPPVGGTTKAEILTARLDYLISAGALDQADALLSTVGIEEPKLFDRWFTINAIAGKFSRACRPLINAANLAKLPERAFCLAQNGDWQTAEVTLSMGTALGEIDPNLASLLSLFLDREEFEDVDPPAPSLKPTALEFILRSEMDLPQSSAPKMALQNFAINSNSGWKSELFAAEALARSGALPTPFLQSVYQKSRRSASGGIWDRVSAVQNLISEKSGAALETAYQTMSAVGLETVLADMTAEEISSLDLTDEFFDLQINLALLHKDFDLLADPIKDGLPQTDPRLAILIQNFDQMQTDSPLETAIKDAFTLDDLSQDRLALLDGQQDGFAVLLALNELSNGANSDPNRIKTGLQTLIRAGFYTEAQQAALQMLILPAQVPG